MKERVLALRYARALGQTLLSDSEFEKVTADLDALSQLLASDDLLRGVLEGRTLSRSSRSELIGEIARA
ncbi:MAG: F0F1 ATP synthase subunit delta, partial [Terriglobia bacterium]